MREATQGSKGKSSDRLWETLEQMVRGKVREFLQEILEDEVTEFLGGRAKSQRKATVGGEPRGYRNGYGKPRNLTLSGGTVQVRRPRVRDVEERFESLVLPLFARRTKEAGELVLQLYLHGLAEGDFELALRGLLGEGTPLSRSTVRRLRQKWVAEHAGWERRSLEGREIVYAWADGIYVKAGLEKDKAALLVVIGAMADGTKEVLAVRPGFRESAESWAAVLRGLKARGLGVPKLLVADGNLGIWAAARQVWPEAAEQRCWNHKIVNVLDRLPKREQEEAKRLLRKIAYAPSMAAAEKAREAFGNRYGDTYPKAVEILAGDWDRMGAFFDFPAGALEAPADDERGREPVCGGAAAHLRRQAVQEGRRRHGVDLEAPHGRGEAVQEAQRSPPAARRAAGRPLQGRPAGPGRAAARSLTSFDGHPARQPRAGRNAGRTRTPAGRPPAPGDGGVRIPSLRWHRLTGASQGRKTNPNRP